MKKKTAEKVLWIFLGTLIMGIATYFFFVPFRFSSGGATGIALILHQLFPSISVGWQLLIINGLLFFLGWLVLGSQFGILTLIGSLSYSLWTVLIETLFSGKGSPTSDPIVAMILGACLTGLGIGLVTIQGASTGGTDILAFILAKRSHIALSHCFLIIDGLIVLASGFAFSLDAAMYDVIATYLMSEAIDKLVTGAERRFVITLITSKLDQVNRYINVDVDRGTTILQGVGGYSGQPQEVLLTVVSRQEYMRIKEYLAEVDPSAFIYVYNANEVSGEGFSYDPNKHHHAAGYQFISRHLREGQEEGRI